MSNLPGPNNAPVRLLAAAILQPPTARKDRLASIVETHSEFAPAFFYLCKEYSRARLGDQTFGEVREEKRLLERFLKLSDQGKLVRHFLDQREAIRISDEAKSRLVSASSVAADSVLENPVTFPVVQPLKEDQWMFFLNIAESCSKILYRVGDKDDFQATKPIPGVSNIDRRTGKPYPNYPIRCN